MAHGRNDCQPWGLHMSCAHKMGIFYIKSPWLSAFLPMSFSICKTSSAIWELVSLWIKNDMAYSRLFGNSSDIFRWIAEQRFSRIPVWFRTIALTQIMDKGVNHTISIASTWQLFMLTPHSAVSWWQLPRQKQETAVSLALLSASLLTLDASVLVTLRRFPLHHPIMWL